MQQRNTDFLKTEAAIQAIECGEAESVMDALYVHLLPEFVGWGKKYFQASAADLDDVFQEVLIAFYLRVSRSPGKPIRTPLLKNFLFGIGAKKLADLFQKRKKNRFWLDNMVHPSIAEDPDVLAFSWNETPVFDADVLRNIVSELSPRCAEILKRTLLENQKIKQVMAEMGYKNENNTSATKGRCLAELKRKLRERFGPETIYAWFNHLTR